MELNKVYLGDALESIKKFPDKCFDCVVTSPPYFGLRDYGTGQWVGGDPNCKHYRTTKVSDKTITGHKRMNEAESPVGDAIYKSVCPLCGAVRIDNQIGLEETPEAYIQKLIELFREIRRCLKDDGTIWVNLGDSYNCYKGNASNPNFDTSYVGGDKGGAHPARESGFGLQSKSLKPKDLMGIPWRFAFAMQADGWYLRQDIIWHKPNPMPESITDRCTKSHEYIFLLSKNEKYYFDFKGIQEKAVTDSGGRVGGNKYGDNDDIHYKYYSGKEFTPQTDNEGNVVRNKRDVWSVPVRPTKEAHFATYPENLIVPCIKAGCPEGGVVLDPFMGSGTTGIVARKLNRNFVGCELNPEYRDMAERRIFNEGESIFNQF